MWGHWGRRPQRLCWYKLLTATGAVFFIDLSAVFKNSYWVLVSALLFILSFIYSAIGQNKILIPIGMCHCQVIFSHCIFTFYSSITFVYFLHWFSYHVVATLGTSRDLAQICRVVIFGFHSCFIAYNSISYFVEELPGCDWKLPATRAVKCPTGLISVTKNHKVVIPKPKAPRCSLGYDGAVLAFHYIPVWTSLAKQHLSAVSVLVETSICSYFSI